MALTSPDPVAAHVATLRDHLGAGLVHLERLPPRPARTAPLARPLPAAVAERLGELGLDALWSHQAEAIDHLRAGRSTVVATGTASGKSLCYQLPIAEAVVDPIKPGTALVLFPTKALAQDQLRSFGHLSMPGLVAATYDGDASPEQRTWARQHANVVLTNPEMLHHGLLPHHGRWATFLMRLRYVVIDELHVLRGVFGTHVAHLLRRLQRLCEHYGSSPTFVFSSATIGQPADLARSLCGQAVAQVTDDGSPHGERLVALVDPGRIEVGDGPPLSANRVTAGLVADLVHAGHRTLAFCRSRAGTEVVAAEVVRRHPDLTGRVRPYRGGYLAAERREIEAQLFSGVLGGVIATSALELGVDVGGLDAVVLNGFPGTIASMWQQAGRAGREGQASVAILVAGDDQLDHYFLNHPDEVFSRPPEPAVVNPANPYVLDPHLACAAYEQPLHHHDERWWSSDLDDGVRRLVVDDQLKLRPRYDGLRAVWAARGHPASGMGLRSGSSGEVRIAFADGTLIGTVDRSRACELVHPGAIYLHQGRPHRVVRLDLVDGAAIVEPADGREYTLARSDVALRITGTDAERPCGRFTVGLGTVEVTSRVTGYQRREVLTGEILGTEELDLPPSHLVTRGVWWSVPDRVLADAAIAPKDVPGTLHAAEHTAIGILPLFTICDRWDVGGVSTPWLDELGTPAVVIYDGYPGGAGIAELGYRSAQEQLAATLELLERCRCTDGCPSCVQSPKCGSWNEPLDKAGARSLLRAAGFVPPTAP
ncbi:DEAD/DEAH box helicase [Aquihabitans sp. G128]|uniref:DEAD/DEAH box helicase n=1 Tax=Aquihabitans sp. G128 TaxID=2849779 RepID=UPI001C23FDCA|nr:DEAD/DEAH box helicase [Aquihabitans sp. G128]QXC60106.1 DEAD/DEAH box helicase [Aquihabitans sp. G128]